MFGTLDERLAAARTARFAGRTRECDALAAAIAGTEPAVVFLHGPGGIGKTTVLDRFVADARAAGLAPIRIDARDAGPPDALIAAIERAIAEVTGRVVLVLDTFELAAPAEAALRGRVLPSLTGAPIAVIAGREAPSLEWRTDPAWHGTLAVLALAPLDERDSADLLARRGVAPAAHARLHRAAHGHPLALALLAELALRDAAWQPELTPDLVATLVDRFVRDVPSPAHRRALDACAVARVTTEHTLRALCDDPPAAVFDWLRGLAFVETGPDGVFPHDLARDVLARELAARDPEAAAELRRRLHADLMSQLGRATEEPVRQRLAYDLVHGRRDRPTVDGFFTFRGAAAEPARDPGELAALIEDHEGPEAAGLVRYWFARQREAFAVFRAPGGGLAGLAVILELAGFTDDDRAADPAIAAAARHAEHAGPLAPGQRAIYTRFFGTAGAWQEVSPIQDTIQVRSITRWLTAHPLGHTFVATRRPDVWALQFGALGWRASEHAAFTTDGVRHAVYAQDWRAGSAVERLFARRAGLDEAALTAAVAAALKDFARAGALDGSPLRDLACVRAAGPPTAETVRAVLRQAIAELAQHPRDAKAAAVLEATYVRPASSQEAAAERLGVPIGTYRRHLKRGVERLGELVCARERTARG